MSEGQADIRNEKYAIIKTLICTHLLAVSLPYLSCGNWQRKSNLYYYILLKEHVSMYMTVYIVYSYVRLISQPAFYSNILLSDYDTFYSIGQ